ncbi:hypothetical protein BXZ70DRAFT_898674 [Cristinia sonorae]|uniref:Uncharacterized protein n=1 Tax=Cristinia sonorae TaxID=1940300 RepID=A0A8K0XLR9_9AGAR|nr:hypothetical protein BXZ70DRAFT_898674 [Cristinia sonorae]
MRGRISATPAAAKSLDFNILQGDPRIVFYHNSRIPVAPPIEAIHPVFASFVRNATGTDDTFLDAPLVEGVSEMMEQAAENQELHALLPTVLIRHFESVQAAEFLSAHGTVAIEIGGRSIAVIVTETVQMWGDGEYSPTTRPQYSTLDLWAKDTMRPIVNASCCPTFIIATTGAWLTILGWAITADVEVVVQPLMDIMWLGEATPYEDTHVYNVARVFAALRKSLHDLEAYYRGLALEPTPNTQSPASFPHPTTFTAADGSEVQFRYLQRLEDNAASVTFLAETVKSGASGIVNKIVVKFVDRYGADAHRLTE